MSEVLLSIMEYSSKTNLSISTIRRMIKSSKIRTKLVNGKYYIYDTIKDETNCNEKYSLLNQAYEEMNNLKNENVILKKKIKSYEDELIDLKTLIKFKN